MSFLFRSEFFFRTTRELEYFFSPEFNIRLYDKNCENIPPPWKLNGLSLRNLFDLEVEIIQ